MSTIFQIAPMEELVDCFRAPVNSASFTPVNGLIDGWPSFHASQADPDGGYTARDFCVNFHMDQPQACELFIKIYVSTPRLPYLRVQVNDQSGHWYPDPVPAVDPVIRPTHALHASIYSVDDIHLFIPASAFVPGENKLILTAIDEEPVMKITNPEAVLRLDRMADACGFHYAALRLSTAPVDANSSMASVRPSVVYVKTKEGLQEECQLVYIPSQDAKTAEGLLLLSWKDGKRSLPFTAPESNFGQHRFDFLLPDGTGEVSYQVSGPVTASGRFARRRKWKVFTTPHAHTDIGYTHRQSEVAERMSRNIDTALALLEGPLKDDFTYILDSSWSLEDYTRTRGEDALGEVLKQAKAGKIGIPANYVDLLTQFASLEELIQNGAYSLSLLEPAGLVADRVDIALLTKADWWKQNRQRQYKHWKTRFTI